LALEQGKGKASIHLQSRQYFKNRKPKLLATVYRVFGKATENSADVRKRPSLDFPMLAYRGDAIFVLKVCHWCG